MELVKDLSDSGIVFYWIDEAGGRISPELATLNLAHEWHQQALFEAYSGEERRVSVIDRRSDRNKRDSMLRNYISSQANPNGRRASDVADEVDLDLVKEKLKEFL
ncbi:MAG: hypothetical protein KBT66_14820 [Amphritea sp.]|nr:hypothetical protein [Amphritea sp.]